jgi:hypothetical protein
MGVTDNSVGGIYRLQVRGVASAHPNSTIPCIAFDNHSPFAIEELIHA